MAHYRFGPLGRLMVCDIPEDGIDMPVAEFGGMHESLNGTRTRDLLGAKNSWKIDVEGLEPRALSWFEMAYHGALGTPLYFVDEGRINRLSRAVSSALSVWADVDPFIEVAGTQVRTTVANTSLLLPGVQDGESVLTPGPKYAQSLATTTGVGLVRCGPMVPVQPGEHLVFSLYILSGTPSIEFTPYDADGVPLAQAGASNTTDPGPPIRKYEEYIVPANGVAAIQPCIRHPGIESSVWTALQLEQGDAPTPWVLGGGAAQVVIEPPSLKRRRVGNYVNASYTLLEV